MPVEEARHGVAQLGSWTASWSTKYHISAYSCISFRHGIIRIDRATLPEGERDPAASIEQNLVALQNNAEEFRQTVDLYRFAHARERHLSQLDRGQRRDMIALVKIAGRNGAVVAYSFSRLMEAINATKAPIMWSKADMAEKKKATRLFASEFPSIAAIRQSAAHPGELAKNSVEQERHRLKAPLEHPAVQATEGVYIEGLMHAAPDSLNFGATFEGKLAQYELSMAKADVLDAVTDHYCRTFYPLEEANGAPTRAFFRESQKQLRRDQRSRPPWWSNLIRL